MKPSSPRCPYGGNPYFNALKLQVFVVEQLKKSHSRFWADFGRILDEFSDPVRISEEAMRKGRQEPLGAVVCCLSGTHPYCRADALIGR